MSTPRLAVYVDRPDMEISNPQGLHGEIWQDDTFVLPATSTWTITDPAGAAHTATGSTDSTGQSFSAAYTPTLCGRYPYTLVTTTPALTASGSFTVRDSSAV